MVPARKSRNDGDEEMVDVMVSLMSNNDDVDSATIFVSFLLLRYQRVTVGFYDSGKTGCVAMQYTVGIVEQGEREKNHDDSCRRDD